MSTPNERRHFAELHDRITELRTFLTAVDPPTPTAAVGEWARYLAAIKQRIGNFNNQLSATACLQAKAYLSSRFDLVDYDSLSKPQGAAGPDVEARTTAGGIIVGEIKTTAPYRATDFGAKQKSNMIDDIGKLVRAIADHKFMFVTDPQAFDILDRKYRGRMPGVELVLLT